MIDLRREKFCVWGFKDRTYYDTFTHIHEAWYRALKFLGKQVLWLDACDSLDGIDFSDTFFITQNCAVQREGALIPRRKDCFYAVHNGIQSGKELFEGLDILPFGVQLHGTPAVERAGCINFPWATDLLPDEIERNKPSRVFNSLSRRVTYVGGTADAGAEIGDFGAACLENGISFSVVTGGISIEENVRRIKESYVAPALIGPFHPKGYLPCRIFKNISYGQYGVTNSPYVRDLFDGRVIFSTSAYDLFYQASETLPAVSVEQLHSVMDYVAENHTYLNRLNTLMTAEKQILEAK